MLEVTSIKQSGTFKGQYVEITKINFNNGLTFINSHLPLKAILPCTLTAFLKHAWLHFIFIRKQTNSNATTVVSILCHSGEGNKLWQKH